MPVFVAADNIISPLGFTSSENFGNLKRMQTGVRLHDEPILSAEPLWAAKIDTDLLNAEFAKLNSNTSYTRLEKLLILSIQDTLNQNPKINIESEKTLMVISTTKGNIDLLEKAKQNEYDKKRIYLWETGRIIAAYFKNPNTPIIVSNACISGVLAIIVGKRILEQDQYDTVIVSGADILTPFVVAGFQSFKAISPAICKPYDATRDGISLGEGSGTLVITNNESLLNESQKIIIKGGSSSNDANHISGPSRTGDGLLLSIERTLLESGTKPTDVDFISGHGTATVFNDEMEALAIADAHLCDVPLNGLKGYFGHTLGASGIIESIVGLHSMKENILIGTYNYNDPGVSKPVNIIKQTREQNINNCLKTAAGFGGCNAAVLFEKK